jgi:hypothetical protein
VSFEATSSLTARASLSRTVSSLGLAALLIGCGSPAREKPKPKSARPVAAVENSKADAGVLSDARPSSGGADAQAADAQAAGSAAATNAGGSDAAGTRAGTLRAAGAGAGGTGGTAPKAAECAPDSYRCDDTTLLICDKAGHFTADSGKHYDSPEACERAKQNGGAVCQAGQFRCVGDTIYKCNDAHSDFIVDPASKPCGAGLCNASLGRCNTCVPRSLTCTDDGKSVRTCSDDGQQTSARACDASAPICVDGSCVECRMDSDPSKTGCAAGNDCVRSNDQLTCKSSSGAAHGLTVEFCHAGACKVALAPGFDLALNADWSACTGSAAQEPLAATTLGVMLWPTTLTDLAIPLANTGWLCKLPPTNGARNSCIVNASQSARELYIWGTIETGCTYAWGVTPQGIDAALGPGCGNCSLVKHASDDSADYAFNLGVDTNCRCPKVHFAALPAKKAP